MLFIFFMTLVLLIVPASMISMEQPRIIRACWQASQSIPHRPNVRREPVKFSDMKLKPVIAYSLAELMALSWAKVQEEKEQARLEVDRELARIARASADKATMAKVIREPLAEHNDEALALLRQMRWHLVNSPKGKGGVSLAAIRANLASVTGYERDRRETPAKLLTIIDESISDRLRIHQGFAQ